MRGLTPSRSDYSDFSARDPSKELPIISRGDCVKRTIAYMLLVASLWSGGLVFAQSSVLSRIESYQAPPLPKDEWPEAYDRRRVLRAGVPSTLTETLACDLFDKITNEAKPRYEVAGARESDVERAIQKYVDIDWRKISGYRPWTHSNFIRGLGETARRQLAGEIVNYARAKRVVECPND